MSLPLRRLTLLAAAALAATPALAQSPPTRTRGTITALTADTATLRTAHGPVKVALPASGYVGAIRAHLADITQGSYIGTAAVPAAASMTNGTVQTAGKSRLLTLTVTYKGGQQTVQVPPSTPVVTLEPGTKSLLHPGAKIVAFGPVAAGIVQATRIIVGEHGTTPPM
jgi:hypothetical protein